VCAQLLLRTDPDARSVYAQPPGVGNWIRRIASWFPTGDGCEWWSVASSTASLPSILGLTTPGR